MNDEKKAKLGVIALLTVTVFWGMGFPLLKMLVGSLQTFGIIALRFNVATLILLLLFSKRLKNLNRDVIKKGFLLSIILFGSYVCGTVGMRYTSSSKASFFSCLSVLIVPFLLFFFLHQPLNKKVKFCVMTATIGVFIMSYSHDMGLMLSLGDVICLGCSVFSALQVVVVSRVAKDYDPILLCIVQLGFIAIFATVAALLFEPIPKSISSADLIVIVILAILCTDYAFCVQLYFQRYIEPSRIGIIFALEPIFGAVFSVFLLKDHIGTNGILGGTIIMLSVFIMEFPISKFFKGHKEVALPDSKIK